MLSQDIDGAGPPSAYVASRSLVASAASYLSSSTTQVHKAITDDSWMSCTLGLCPQCQGMVTPQPYRRDCYNHINSYQPLCSHKDQSASLYHSSSASRPPRLPLTSLNSAHQAALTCTCGTTEVASCLAQALWHARPCQLPTLVQLPNGMQRIQISKASSLQRQGSLRDIPLERSPTSFDTAALIQLPMAWTTSNTPRRTACRQVTLRHQGLSFPPCLCPWPGLGLDPSLKAGLQALHGQT